MAAFFIGCKFTYSYFFKLNLKFYASILTINNFQSKMENPNNEDISIQIEETLHLFLWPNSITIFFPFQSCFIYHVLTMCFYLLMMLEPPDLKDHDTKSCMIQVSRYLLYHVTEPLYIYGTSKQWQLSLLVVNLHILIFLNLI
jgi:hypothetical protein